MSKYTVQPGDTLTKIAARAGVTVNDLCRVNNLADPNRIRVGQVLTIGEYTGKNPSHDAELKPVKSLLDMADECLAAIEKIPEFQALMEAVTGD